MTPVAAIADLPKQAARAAVSNALFVPTQAVLTLVASAAVTRVLGAQLFGLFAIFQALKSTLSFYSDLGTSSATSKLFPEVVAVAGRRGGVQLLAYQACTNAAATLLLAGALALATPLCVRLFSIPAQYEFLIWYAWIGLVIDESARLAQVFLWARFANTQVNVTNLVGAAAQPLFVITTSALGGSLRGVIVATLAASGLRALLMIVFALHQLTRIAVPGVEAAPAASVLRRFVRLAALGWTEKLSSYLYGPSFATLLVATMFDKVEVGLFSLASDFTLRLMSFVLSPTHGIILPAFATVFFQGSLEQRQRIFSSTLRIVGMLLAPSGALLFGLAPYLVSTIYSPSYADAAQYVRILAFFYFTEYAVYAPANAALLAGEQLTAYSRIKLTSIAALPIFVAVSAALSLPWIAVLYGTLRLGIALALLAVAVRTHSLRVPVLFYASLAAAAAASAVVVAALVSVIGSHALGAAAGIATVAAIMLICQRKAGWTTPEDWSMLKRLDLPGSTWLLRLLHRS
jgi:O-antigen/teichoic acid export membrane protein